MDSNYTEYSEYVKKDKNYVTNYSKRYIKKKENYSEDFADSFSLYFRNCKKLKSKYTNRYEYISNLFERFDLRYKEVEYGTEN